MKIFVIGAGIAGIEAAITSSSLGSKVIIFDEQIGGNFLNKTCIPTKILLESSEYERNFSKLMKRAKEKIHSLKREYEKKLIDKGIEIISFKCLVKKNELKFGDQQILLENSKFIICTGSKPLKPIFPGSQYLKYSDEILEMEDLPNRIAIIGGGPEGLELAEFFNKLGCKVTVIEKKDLILPSEDEDISKIALENLQEKGIEVILKREVKGIRKNNGYLVLTDNEEVKADLVFSCIGWTPCTDNIFLDNLIPNDFLMIDNNIYAAGDVIGAGIANVAKLQGRIAAYNANGYIMKFEKKVYPYVINTEHKIASFGEKERSSKDNKVFKTRMNKTLKSYIEDSMGYIKIICNVEGRIKGASCISKRADEIINFLYALSEKGVKIDELKNYFPSSPSYIEDMLDSIT